MPRYVLVLLLARVMRWAGLLGLLAAVVMVAGSGDSASAGGALNGTLFVGLPSLALAAGGEALGLLRDIARAACRRAESGG